MAIACQGDAVTASRAAVVRELKETCRELSEQNLMVLLNDALVMLADSRH